MAGTSAAAFYVNYSATPDAAVIAACDISSLSANARVNLADLKRRGHRAFAYLSRVEVAPDAAYRADVLAAKIPCIGRDDAWRSDLVDVTSAAWEEFVVNTLAARAATRGFDGFFLDTVDSLELLAQKFPARAKEFDAAAVGIVRALKARHPGKPLILNRGFRIWDAALAHADGVLIESLFRTFDSRTGPYTAVPKDGTDWLLGKLAPARAAKLPVYVVDYVDPAQRALAEETARRIEELGFSAFITTPALDGKALGPKPRPDVPRRLLCLFGNQSQDPLDGIRWPADSSVAQVVQMPLEWLGYEVDYLDPSRDALPDALPRHAGVLLDRFLRVPPTREAEVVSWLVRQVRAGRKLVVLGELPFQEESPLKLLMRELGLGGTGRAVRGLTGVKATVTAPQMNHEARVFLSTNRFLDLAAPAGARRLLSVAAQGTTPGSRVFDAVFTAPWGGMALDPDTSFRWPDLDEHWLVDPFYFLATALQTPDWPAPDPTTRDGVRLLYAHIDGDGFRHFSTVQACRRSSEVVFERVVKRYPFPFTCLVIEAEIRARAGDQKPSEEAEMVRIAREIFALPRVEAASHTYSHPFYWTADDRTARLYERVNLQLRPPFERPGVDVEQEVRGSAKFIEESLLPAGKRVRVFLWPGNCRPTIEALRATRELGIENMNGGETVHSRRHPSISRVSARGVPWGDEFQIYAANENENVHQGRWGAGLDSEVPFYGGFIHSQDGFERMDRPRRLKPVNIYFHWYSGDYPAALNALVGLFDWAEDQELHAVSASQYARLVRDARATRLARDDAGRWAISNMGDLRTVRPLSHERTARTCTGRGGIGLSRPDDQPASRKPASDKPLLPVSPWLLGGVLVAILVLAWAFTPSERDLLARQLRDGANARALETLRGMGAWQRRGAALDYAALELRLGRELLDTKNAPAVRAQVPEAFRIATKFNFADPVLKELRSLIAAVPDLQPVEDAFSAAWPRMTALSRRAVVDALVARALASGQPVKAAELFTPHWKSATDASATAEMVRLWRRAGKPAAALAALESFPVPRGRTLAQVSRPLARWRIELLRETSQAGRALDAAMELQPVVPAEVPFELLLALIPRMLQQRLARATNAAPGDYRRLAHFHGLLGDSAAVRDALRAGVAAFPANGELRVQLACALAAGRDFAGAARVVERHPRLRADVDLAHLYASLLLDAERRDEAVAFLTSVDAAVAAHPTLAGLKPRLVPPPQPPVEVDPAKRYAADPANPQNALDHAWQLFNARRHAQAERVLKPFLASRPTPAVAPLAAQLAAVRSNYALAEQWQRRYLASNPVNAAAAWSFLGDIYSSLGDEPKARAAWQRGLKLSLAEISKRAKP